jgi:outer membrane lipoprotein-sorting protein
MRRACAIGWLVFAVQVAPAAAPAGVPPASGVVIADAEVVYDAVVGQYGAIETYRQTCTYSEQMAFADGFVSAPMPFDSPAKTSTFLFARPDRYAVTTDDLAVYSDGEWLWLHDRKRHEYTEERASDETLTAWSFFEHLGTFELPVATVLSYLVPEAAPGCSPSGLVDDSETGVRYDLVEELRNGEPGLRISFTVETEDGPLEGHIWVSSETGAIEQWRYQVYAQHYPSGYTEGAEPVVQVADVTIDCSDVVLDKPIPDEAFRFRPGPDDRRVEELTPHFHDSRPPWEETTAATLSMNDGSLEDLDPERLVLVGATPSAGVGLVRRLARQDVDGDSVPDLLLGGALSGVTVLSGATGEQRAVPLRGRTVNGSVGDILAIAVDGRTMWLVQTNHYREDPRAERSIVALHGPDGDERWVYSPELPESLSSEAAIAAGDLDGDGSSEIVVGFSLSRLTAAGEQSWTVEPKGTVLAVLDLDGSRILQRTFPNQILAVQVTAPPDGGPGRVVCVFDSGVSELELR